MQLTKHAAERLVQRNFPLHVSETILTYGKTRFVRGAESVLLDDEALNLVAAEDRRLAISLERYRGVYVIVGEEERIVTAVRSNSRLKH